MFNKKLYTYNDEVMNQYNKCGIFKLKLEKLPFYK